MHRGLQLVFEGVFAGALPWAEHEDVAQFAFDDDGDAWPAEGVGVGHQLQSVQRSAEVIGDGAVFAGDELQLSVFDAQLPRHLHGRHVEDAVFDDGPRGLGAGGCRWQRCRGWGDLLIGRWRRRPLFAHGVGELPPHVAHAAVQAGNVGGAGGGLPHLDDGTSRPKQPHLQHQAVGVAVHMAFDEVGGVEGVGSARVAAGLGWTTQFALLQHAPQRFTWADAEGPRFVVAQHIAQVRGQLGALAADELAVDPQHHQTLRRPVARPRRRREREEREKKEREEKLKQIQNLKYLKYFTFRNRYCNNNHNKNFQIFNH